MHRYTGKLTRFPGKSIDAHERRRNPDGIEAPAAGMKCALPGIVLLLNSADARERTAWFDIDRAIPDFGVIAADVLQDLQQRKLLVSARDPFPGFCQFHDGDPLRKKKCPPKPRPRRAEQMLLGVVFLLGANDSAREADAVRNYDVEAVPVLVGEDRPDTRPDGFLVASLLGIRDDVGDV
jgi:hypothetical protein